jgi:nitrous oxidase accessory protein NosD
MRLRFVSLLAALGFLAFSASGKQLHVCPTGGAPYTTIQSAVDAASPGDTIHICAATFAEQVSINKSLDIDADSGAILMPSAMTQNASSLFDASPLAVALLVTNTSNVSIAGLIVDGTNSGISACAPELFGIAFLNASGSIRRTTVRDFKLAASLNGCQSGTGIFVQSGGGQSSNVWIDATSIHDFQKNGITANEVGTEVFVRGNFVTGLGPTTGAAQNGIQVGFGATGFVTGNTVSNTIYSPCTAVATCTNVATNILIEQSDGVTVVNNTVSVSQVGIFVDANSAEIAANQSSGNYVFDGIRLEGNSNRAGRNTVFTSGESGIFLDGNNNVVRNNSITDAAIGILKTTGSTGNLIQFNSIFDCPITIQDPSARSIAKLLSPQR